MNVKSQVGAGILATCLASAAAAALATPAAAAEAPVDLPLQSLGGVLPVTPPTVSTAMPLLTPGMPQDLGHVGEGGLPELTLLPRTPIGSEFPETRVGAPMPSLLGGRPLGTALLTSPRSDVETSAPGASLGEPLSLPRGGEPGLPGVRLPKAAALSPTLSGVLESDLGLSPQEG
ncbi:hypothetical protein [Streptomyces kanasensis]|uniref:Secreted protein n=1 Tax=Streptomyces kanasensis TaxID=936756 RepID=A0A100Y914_9ACTN|nr:hypothetical protein [Streptomyces kanasensis]KUH39897.1 hypothetical protein ATE80_04910 [Streptomyces kanasensis]